MKKIAVFLLLLCLSSFGANTYSSLFDFIFLVSKHNSVKIVADESIDPANYMFFYQDDGSLSIDEFRLILKQKNLYLHNKDDFYVISDKEPLKDDLRSIKLKNQSSKSLGNILNLFDINASYYSNTNSIHFRADTKTFNQILNVAKDLDSPISSATFKIVITETNLKDIKDKGADLSSILKPINRGDLSLFVNLISSPYLSNTNIIKHNQSAYFGVINFLESNGITKIISSPFLTAFNDNEVSFSSVNTIPYLSSQTEANANQSTTTSSYSYKDVGLKINLKPNFIDEGIKLELSLVLEDILTDTNILTPTTSKKELKGSYFLKRGEILVLSGINKTHNQTLRNGVPILKDIWLLKYLFSVEQTQDINSVLTISIQAI